MIRQTRSKRRKTLRMLHLVMLHNGTSKQRKQKLKRSLLIRICLFLIPVCFFGSLSGQDKPSTYSFPSLKQTCVLSAHCLLRTDHRSELSVCSSGSTIRSFGSSERSSHTPIYSFFSSKQLSGSLYQRAIVPKKTSKSTEYELNTSAAWERSTVE